VREKTHGEAGWFAYRTDVSLGRVRPARAWRVWAAVAVAACGAAAVYGAYLLLVSLDVYAADQSLGNLLRLTALFPTERPA
jgi:hypothetical protein